MIFWGFMYVLINFSQDPRQTEWQKDTIRRAELDFHSYYWHNCMERPAERFVLIKIQLFNISEDLVSCQSTTKTFQGPHKGDKFILIIQRLLNDLAQSEPRFAC